MIKLKAFVFLLLLSLQVFGQSYELNVHKNKLSDYINFEESKGSILFKNKYNHMTTDGVAQPIIYRHLEEGIPDLLSYIFYYKKDSSISYLSYEWDESNIEKNDKTKVWTHNECNNLFEKYIKLFQLFSSKYGESTNKDKIGILPQNDSFERIDKWTPNDSIEISVNIVISNKYESNGWATTVPTHRIRLNIYNKVKNISSSQQVEGFHTLKLDSTSKAFFAELKNKNFKQAKGHLSDKIIDKVSEEQLNQIAQVFDFNNVVEMYMSGKQTSNDGTIYNMVQYKYSSDKSNPPKTILKLLFDEKNKIAGIQPLKMM